MSRCRSGFSQLYIDSAVMAALVAAIQAFVSVALGWFAWILATSARMTGRGMAASEFHPSWPHLLRPSTPSNGSRNKSGGDEKVVLYWNF